ncbi:MAG: hypothetical protein ACRBFS_10505 [Aureispira sp.]
MGKKLTNKKYLKHLKKQLPKVERQEDLVERLIQEYNKAPVDHKKDEKMWRKIEAQKLKLVNMGGSSCSVRGWIQETEAAIARGEKYS